MKREKLVAKRIGHVSGCRCGSCIGEYEALAETDRQVARATGHAIGHACKNCKTMFSKFDKAARRKGH